MRTIVRARFKRGALKARQVDEGVSLVCLAHVYLNPVIRLFLADLSSTMRDSFN
jgi:hypothetical protein